MLEPIAYDIGRLCKEKDKELTPKLIEIDFKADGIKMPFDTYRELTPIFKKSFIGCVEYKGNEIKYQILNFGKHVDLIELEDADLYIIADGRRLIERKELQIIPKIREKISPNSAIYFPAALPWEIPLLVYMGVDYFDNSLAKLYASMGYKFTKNRAIKVENYNFEELYNNNKRIYEEVLKEVRIAIKNGFLRNVVEETAVSHPHLWANYRRYEPDLRNIPLSKENKIIVTTNINIPEVKKYLNRLDRYEPYSNVIVLLPCSSKKPYSTSQSHQKFIKAIKSSKVVVEEVILTSPYGLVPRALEGLVNYDIPVTGEWSFEEIKLINNCLKNFLKKVEEKFDDYVVIAHLPKHYLEILDLDDVIITSKGNPTSEEDLKNLTNTLKKYREITKNINKKGQKIHNIKQLAKFQFGVDFIPNEIFMNPKGQIFTKISGKNQQIASINPKNDLLVLTLSGGKLLWNAGGKNISYVEVNYEIKKGSLFPPGFVDCNENISYNDEVVLIKDNEFLGIGRALMSGFEMKKAKHGALVNIRNVKR
ncbi:archaeosine synthase subunit alpha [Methanocaldococcus fervens]|uniref:PUA domain containing protein n=1 Tax=Methanocaldococcus fervens (strain DSM 4213 / JCM 15782 / AG86) TaxID=573064 RepID=C7P7B9_METFA|nr:archaeosine synthase subunit alpha [Methanocaldococcus fervens]ACV24451.1 PUA domain containing protein [Methanocaldococcus fervens AG86]